jgi:hypothetical protein
MCRFTTTQASQATIVYDVNGNEVGTIADIFGASIAVSASPATESTEPWSQGITHH